MSLPRLTRSNWKRSSMSASVSNGSNWKCFVKVTGCALFYTDWINIRSIITPYLSMLTESPSIGGLHNGLGMLLKIKDWWVNRFIRLWYTSNPVHQTPVAGMCLNIASWWAARWWSWFIAFEFRNLLSKPSTCTISSGIRLNQVKLDKLCWSNDQLLKEWFELTTGLFFGVRLG